MNLNRFATFNQTKNKTIAMFFVFSIVFSGTANASVNDCLGILKIPKENYIKIMGLEAGFTPEQLKKTFRILMRKCHPDIVEAQLRKTDLGENQIKRTLADLNEAAKRITAANEALKNGIFSSIEPSASTSGFSNPNWWKPPKQNVFQNLSEVRQAYFSARPIKYYLFDATKFLYTLPYTAEIEELLKDVLTSSDPALAEPKRYVVALLKNYLGKMSEELFYIWIKEAAKDAITYPPLGTDSSYNYHDSSLLYYYDENIAPALTEFMFSRNPRIERRYQALLEAAYLNPINPSDFFLGVTALRNINDFSDDSLLRHYQFLAQDLANREDVPQATKTRIRELVIEELKERVYYTPGANASGAPEKLLRMYQSGRFPRIRGFTEKRTSTAGNQAKGFWHNCLNLLRNRKPAKPSSNGLPLPKD